MKTYIHGTTEANAMHIVSRKRFDTHDTVWLCSDREMLYVRDIGEEDADMPLSRNESKDECMENAQIAAAFWGSKSDKLALIHIEMEDEDARLIVHKDISHPNARGSYQIEKEKLNGMIEKGRVRIKAVIYKDAYIPYLRPFYLMGVDDGMMEIEDSLLVYVINQLNKEEVYLNNIIWDYGDVYCTIYG